MPDKNVESSLAIGEVYHIVSRSIARYQIYNTDADYSRMTELLRFYQVSKPVTKYSMFLRLQGTQNMGFKRNFEILHKDNEKLVEIIAYCLMPNHIHLVLKQLVKHGISTFVANILNSYSRYFNLLHKRKGPLWESRFKHFLVKDDAQLLHLTRYVHLNPCSAKLVNKSSQWRYSSYLEYIKDDLPDPLTSHEELIDLSSKDYAKFVNDRKDYQRKLSEIKNIINLQPDLS